MQVYLFLLFVLGISHGNEEGEDYIHFTNSWAVHIDTDDIQSVNNIAAKHGFINQGQVDIAIYKANNIAFYYIISHYRMISTSLSFFLCSLVNIYLSSR